MVVALHSVKFAPRVRVNVQTPMFNVRLDVGKCVRTLHYCHDIDSSFMIVVIGSSEKSPSSAAPARHAHDGDLAFVHAGGRRDGVNELGLHRVDVVLEGVEGAVDRDDGLDLFGVETHKAGVAPAPQLRRAARHRNCVDRARQLGEGIGTVKVGVARRAV